MNVHALKLISVSLLGTALVAPVAPVWAQHQGHTMPMPAAKPPPRKPASKPASKPAPKAGSGVAGRPAKKSTPAVDHAAMGHGAAAPVPAPTRKPRPAPARPRAPEASAKGVAAPAGVDHAAMGHGTPAAASTPVDHAAKGHGASTPGTDAPVDHAAMGHGTSAPTAQMDHGGMDGAMQDMDHAAMGHGAGEADLPPGAAPRTPIRALTAADRAAAFPADAHGHEVHDQGVFSYWLLDRLEWQDTDEGSLGWEGLAWIGRDVNRVWLRTEGEASDGGVESANAEVLFGRAITPWWDAVAGVRHDFGRGPSRTYAAVGFQGLAPYKFEVEATAFIGTRGRGGATLEAEYDTLITNRLILQWQGEMNLYAKDDPGIGVGSGLSTIEAGARLRYEFTRRFAPYVGVEFERSFGDTAQLRRVAGEATRDTRLVAGIRFWF